MPARRRHHPSAASPQGDDGYSTGAVGTKGNQILSFSDDEEIIPNSMNVSIDQPIPADMVGDVGSESTLAHLSGAETDEVERDIHNFNKAVHISNLNLVDHSELLRKMHERFKRKVQKWERMAYSYARYSFAMSFTILILQLLQMVLNQAANIWIMNDKEIMDGQRRTKSFFQSVSSYQFSSWRLGSTGSETQQSASIWSAILQLAMTHQFLQTIYSFITALTAIIAGLQLKLKFSEKAERYRKGAKVYGRLLRTSSYYIMMIESGGKVDDVSGLWRDAMKKEGKWIPLVRTYVPL